MLDIRDMSEKDKHFTFMKELKLWTRIELQRQKVADVSTTMGATECLIDNQSEPRKERLQVNSQFRGGGNRSFKPTSNSNGRENYSHQKEGHQDDYQDSHRSSYQSNHQGSHWNKGKAPENKSSTAPRKDSQLTSGTSGSKQHVPQASSHCEANFEEDKDVVGAFLHRCRTISHRVIENGKINEKPIKAVVDTGTTHNYLASPEVEHLGLVLEKNSRKVKTINSFAQSIAGVAKSVLIKVRLFEWKTNLSAVQMDDFKLILGLEFLQDTKTVV
ncbi:Uncharacterized protein Adt_11019 [Abeliophyllum distichum]|uniref:Uncharacterized protein n=1 Tax=Abeliophyllum distichum TaxID=126358 RepID=A0ABD1UN71_9LAMI